VPAADDEEPVAEPEARQLLREVAVLRELAVAGIDQKIAELRAKRALILDKKLEDHATPPRRRRMSKTARLAISRRMKARWAKVRKAQTS